MWMTLTFLGTASIFLAMALATLWHLRWVQRLPALDTLPPAKAKIRCSIVIAARDEEARIEQTLRQLLAQREVELEIIVVDDRSKDRTGEILQQIAREDPRVKVKRVDVLPEGWLGKCHACHVGAGATTGDWILFTDADCWLKPDMIARAVRLAEAESADHIALAFAPSSRNLGLRASHLLFLIGTSNWISGANRDTGKRYIGFGSFNLVRNAVYRQCGGYEALRLTVLDDVKLGLLVQRAGKRTRAFLGGDEVECHFGTNAFSIVKLMEKNYFAAMEYRTPLVILGSAAVICFSAVVILGLLSATVVGLIAALSSLLLAIPGMVLAHRLRWSKWSALLIPVMFPVFYYTVCNSAFVTLRHGGIRWRETFYPLAQLRAGNVK
jgi:glycosyltransferase involved in cell wall biosynthesis